MAENTLAVRLRELREEAVFTVRELSVLSGISEDAITKIENGHRKARPSTIRRLAKALNAEPQELIASPVELSGTTGAEGSMRGEIVGTLLPLRWEMKQSSTPNRVTRFRFRNRDTDVTPNHRRDLSAMGLG